MLSWRHWCLRQTAKTIYAEECILEEGKEYTVHGPLFFGSTTAFKSLFSPEQDPEFVIIDFTHSRVADHSAIDAIKSIAERYVQCGKTLRLRNLSQACQSVLCKANSLIDFDAKAR